MKDLRPSIVLLLALVMTGCAQMPEATGTGALAVAASDVALTAAEVGDVVSNDINIPIWMVGIAMLAAWMVRTPWGMVSDFIGMRKSRQLLV